MMRVMEHLVNERDEALRWSILVGKQKHKALKPVVSSSVLLYINICEL